MDNLEITPADVKTRLDQGEKPVLIDVREPWEYALCRIEGQNTFRLARWRRASRRFRMWTK